MNKTKINVIFHPRECNHETELIMETESDSLIFALNEARWHTKKKALIYIVDARRASLQKTAKSRVMERAAPCECPHNLIPPDFLPHISNNANNIEFTTLFHACVETQDFASPNLARHPILKP